MPYTITWEDWDETPKSPTDRSMSALPLQRLAEERGGRVRIALGLLRHPKVVSRQ